MKKIVINSCFGGFSLSPKGEKRLAELQGQKIFFYRRTKYSFREGIDEYCKIESLDKNDSFRYTFTRDLGDVINEIPNDNELWFNTRDQERDDKYLVQVVEELGKEANGACADLEIIEIPDDVEWQIEEYDGYEHVAERHRTWR